MLKFDENIYFQTKIKQIDFKSSKLNYENKKIFMTCPISRCSVLWQNAVRLIFSYEFYNDFGISVFGHSDFSPLLLLS